MEYYVVSLFKNVACLHAWHTKNHKVHRTRTVAWLSKACPDRSPDGWALIPDL